MIDLLRFVSGLATDLVRRHGELLAENALLRQQPIVAHRKVEGRVHWEFWRATALPASVVGGIPDDRLFTIADVAGLLKVPKSVVYSACDHGDLQYVRFEGAVQVEGRDLKAWLATCHRTESPSP